MTLARRSQFTHVWEEDLTNPQQLNPAQPPAAGTPISQQPGVQSAVNNFYSQVTWPTNVIPPVAETKGAPYTQHEKTGMQNYITYNSIAQGLQKVVNDAYSIAPANIANFLLSQYNVNHALANNAYKNQPSIASDLILGATSLGKSHFPSVGTIQVVNYSSYGGPSKAIPSNYGQVTPTHPNSMLPGQPYNAAGIIEWGRQQPVAYHPVHGYATGAPPGFHYATGFQQMMNNPNHTTWAITGNIKGGDWAAFEVTASGQKYANPNNLPAGFEPNDISKLRASGNLVNISTGQTIIPKMYESKTAKWDDVQKKYVSKVPVKWEPVTDRFAYGRNFTTALPLKM